ncbi:MAG: YHYH domain-containing protein [Alphaproteobacteria bacterium]|nr:YHYH domain-containing protein [Alphaproteobacteria bacterium]
MKNLIRVVVLALTVSAATNVFAHSGGTDANGCHAGSQPYHCH